MSGQLFRADRDRPDVSDEPRRPPSDEDLALGRKATRPGEIPPRGWWQVVRRVASETVDDQLTLVAASCAFYALLALFPALSVLVSLYGLMFDPAGVQSQLQAVSDLLPESVYQLLAGRIQELVGSADRTLGWGLLIGILLALWSSMAGTKAMMTALNVCYEEEERRGFLLFNTVALLFTLGGIIGVSLALSIIVGVPAVLSFGFLGGWAALALRLVSWGLLGLFLVLGLALLYRYGPSRQSVRWRWVTPGSVLVALLWLATSAAFSFYVANVASYDVTYGSLGTAIIVLMWLYVSALVVLVGAELNGELELQTDHDTTSGASRPMGDRGAFVADHVAAR